MRMMTALPSFRGKAQNRRLSLSILLSYIIGLGPSLPLFFEFKTEEMTECPEENKLLSLLNNKNSTDEKCFDAYVPWLKVTL